jgi:transcriptional regulator with XRE-family HTH domain
MSRSTVKERPVLAQQLRALRRTAGFSQQALAVAAGLSLTVVAQLEQGVGTDPRLSTVLALTRALGVTISELLPGE